MQKQSKPLPNQNFYLVQKNVFCIKILFKKCKKQVHKGYPLAGPCICNEKLELALAIKKQPFWL